VMPETMLSEAFSASSAKPMPRGVASDSCSSTYALCMDEGVSHGASPTKVRRPMHGREQECGSSGRSISDAQRSSMPDARTPAGSCGSRRASSGNRARGRTSWICQALMSTVGRSGTAGMNSVRVVGRAACRQRPGGTAKSSSSKRRLMSDSLRTKTLLQARNTLRIYYIK